MSVQTLTCPYCNAAFARQASWSAGQRIICPRCGDSFPLRLEESLTGRPRSPQPSSTAITAEAPAAEVSLPARWSNRLIGGVVLGVMLLMAGGGLAFMLLTQEQRRAYDTSRPPRRPGKQRPVPEEDNVPLVASVAPDKLAALGYLPSGVNFLFAVRLPELLAGPAGERLMRDPIQLAETRFRLENLPKWLGFRPDEIDHFVFAARVDNTVPPPFYVVLRTAAPYAAEPLRQRLKGTRVASLSKKTLFSFRIPRPDIPLHAWCADERTVVLALFADQLEQLPSKPVDDLQQLPQELRTLLKQRREPAAPAWIAGHSPREWSKTSAAMFLGRMKKEDADKLAYLRTLGVFIVPIVPAEPPAEQQNDKDELVVKGVFACTDESAARGLEEHFRTLRGPDPDFKTALDGPWLSLQFHTSPDFLARWLKR
jgi:phage FluMu protein Com